MVDSAPVSKSAVRKAGSALRRIARGEAPEDGREAVLATIDAYRRSFAKPLETVNDELVALLASHGIDAEVSQRLKRMPTIVEKITQREAELDLSRMQDIGGCRIVLKTDHVAALYDLSDIIHARWRESVRRCSDYVAEPRSSGYRAIHIVIERDGRLIEVQLRTGRMHEWAELVEGLSASLGENYKQDGQSLVQDYARLLSQVHVDLDGGASLTSEDVVRFISLAHEVRDMLSQRRPDQSSRRSHP